MSNIMFTLYLELVGGEVFLVLTKLKPCANIKP